MPKVSVVIPSYNCAVYLPKAVESVLAQTFQDLEILVVDDGSNDNTAEVLAPYLDRIHYLPQANCGLPGARNTGIRKARGEYIALLDADDSWLPEKLAHQLPCFSTPEVGIVYSDFSVCYADGRSLASYLADRPLASEGWVVDHYLQSRFLFPSTMVFRRECFEQCGLFDQEMLAAEDIELFTRMCLRWQVKRVNECLMVRTEGTHNITANGGKMNTYTILAFEKILQREGSLPATTLHILHRELARQLWWRGYAAFRGGNYTTARQDLLRSMRLDRRNVRQAAPVYLASSLPSVLLNRLLR